MLEVIDLVTPPKEPSTRRSTLPSHAAAAEITFFDFTAAESPSPVSAQGISNDDRKSASCPPSTAATSGQKILQWVCEVCKVKRFLDYREACKHEESCGKVGNARDGGGGLPPPLPPSRVSSMSTTVASRVVAANASTTEKSHSSPKRKKSRKTCGGLLGDARLRCQLMKDAQLSYCLSPAVNPCPVCPGGITVAQMTAVGSARKTCADLLVDKIMNAEESGNTCAGMFEVDVNDDDNPCYNIVAFSETCRKLRECGYDETKATEITIAIYSRPKRTDIAAINRTVSSQSTAEERTESFDEEASLAATAPAALGGIVDACVKAILAGEGAANASTKEESSFAAAADASTKGDYIHSEGQQLYSEAEWLQNTVQQKHDVSVLSAYVIRFHT
jgi:hypothetical protein